MATRDLSGSVAASLSDNVIKPFFAVEMLFDTSPLRIWTGLDDETIDGNTYTGTGNLLNVSSVEETSEIAVRGATLTLSGMPSEVISLALQEPYQGRVCNIYLGMFIKGDLLQEDGEHILQENNSKIALEAQDTSLTQVFSGYMDEMNIDEGAESGTIELKVENKLIDLERARVRRFTSGYQKSVYPGDKGFDFVEDLQDKDIVWGRAVQ